MLHEPTEAGSISHDVDSTTKQPTLRFVYATYPTNDTAAAICAVYPGNRTTGSRTPGSALPETDCSGPYCPAVVGG